jgi:hypothetical protein
MANIITFSMVFALFSPNQLLNSMFGGELDGPMAMLIVRNWGVLIALTGGMLIYGAFKAEQRPMVLVVSGLSKVTFIGLLISHGFAQQMLPTLIMDCVFVMIFAIYLFSPQNQEKLA